MNWESIVVGRECLWKGQDENGESFCREFEVLDRGIGHGSNNQPYYCKVTGKLKSGEIVEINSRDLHPLQGNDK